MYHALEKDQVNTIALWIQSTLYHVSSREEFNEPSGSV